jgi:L-amino acid N-acyltransferase YncA
MTEIIEMDPRHWAAVERIYLEGIATGQATFQTESPGWEEWDKSHTAACRLVAVDGDEVLGWAALTPVSGRCVYAGVAEVSVYIAEKARGRGLGKALLEALIAESEQDSYWTLQASIFPENSASLRLHQNAGFRIIGTRERIGQMHGIWRDTVMLERRSKIIGTS